MKRVILDRVEESVAVFCSGDGTVYECDSARLPSDTREGAAFDLELDELGFILSLTTAENPDAGRSSKRLRALFNKSKNK